QLQRAVVDEDDTVGSDVPGAENPPHGFGLGLPVDFQWEDPVPGQDQVGPGERLFDDLWVILTGDTKQDTGVRQGPEHLLVKGVHVAVAVQVPGNAIDANLANDSGPEGVIQVGDEALPWLGGPESTNQ